MQNKIFLLDGRSATDHFPGIGRYVSNLAQAIPPILTEDEHLLILRDVTEKSQWQLPLSSEKVTVIDTAVSPFALKQQWQIPNLLKEYQIACYHSPYYLMPYRIKAPTILDTVRSDSAKISRICSHKSKIDG